MIDSTDGEVGGCDVPTSSFKFDFVITTYELLRNDAHHFRSVPWLCVVADEGHRLKNPKSATMQCLQSIKSTHRLVLTGTPLQNNVTELWSILHYLNPSEFPCEQAFADEFGLIGATKPVPRRSDMNSGNAAAAAASATCLSFSCCSR